MREAGMNDKVEAIHKAFLKLTKRAEKVSIGVDFH
jgi:hypothetical protein